MTTTYRDVINARIKGAEGFEIHPPELPAPYPAGMTNLIDCVTLDEVYTGFAWVIAALAQERYGDARPAYKRKTVDEEISYLHEHSDMDNRNVQIIVYLLQRYVA